MRRTERRFGRIKIKEVILLILVISIYNKTKREENSGISILRNLK
jgi:hypothetical protein